MGDSTVAPRSKLPPPPVDKASPAGDRESHLKKQSSIPRFVRGGGKKKAPAAPEKKGPACQGDSQAAKSGKGAVTVHTVQSVKKEGNNNPRTPDQTMDEFLELERQINMAGEESLVTSDDLLSGLLPEGADEVAPSGSRKSLGSERSVTPTESEITYATTTTATSTCSASNVVSLTDVNLRMEQNRKDNSGAFSGRSDRSETSSQCSSMQASSSLRSGAGSQQRKPPTEYVTTAVSDGVWYDTAKPRVSGYAARFQEKKKAACPALCECTDCRSKLRRQNSAGSGKGGKAAGGEAKATPPATPSSGSPKAGDTPPTTPPKMSAREIAKRRADEKLAAASTPEAAVVKAPAVAKEKQPAIAELKKEIDALKSVRERELYSNRSCDVERYRERLAQQIVAVDQKYKNALKEWKGDHSEMHNTIKALKSRLMEQRQQFEQAQKDMEEQMEQIRENKERDAQVAVSEYEELVTSLEAQKVDFQIKYEEAMDELERLHEERAERERQEAQDVESMKAGLLEEQKRLQAEKERIQKEKEEIEEARRMRAGLEKEQEMLNEEKKRLERERLEVERLKRMTEEQMDAIEKERGLVTQETEAAARGSRGEEAPRLDALKAQEAGMARREEDVLDKMAAVRLAQGGDTSISESSMDHIVLEASPSAGSSVASGAAGMPDPLPAKNKKSSRKGLFTCGALSSPGGGVMDYMPSMPTMPSIWGRKKLASGDSDAEKAEK